MGSQLRVMDGGGYFGFKNRYIRSYVWSSSLRYHFEGGTYFYNPNVLTFCLGVEHRECSLAKLSWRWEYMKNQ